MTDYRSYLSKDTLAIFLLHGVMEKKTYKIRNYTRKHLEKDSFYKTMKALKTSGYPVSMDDVVQCHISGAAYPPNAFAVTLDDGFENNFSIAAPVLQDLGIPATFYVTTGFIQNNEMSWIDRIEYCFEHTRAKSLSLPWDASEYDISTPENAIGVLDAIRSKVKQEEGIDIQSMISAIFKQCGIDEIFQSDDPLDRKMTWDQIHTLHENDDFIIGGHTHTHAIMAFLNDQALEGEIAGSLSLLKNRAGISTRHYSYPEGLSHCYSDGVIDALQRHGIVCSPTAIEGANTIRDSLFHLKRVMVV